MHSSDDDFDTEYGSHYEEREDDSVEACVWQFLLMINPGDEEMALQQFTAFRDAIGNADVGDIEPLAVIDEVIDWRSGFQVSADDTHTLVQAINELTSRWNLSVDWEGDPDEDEFHEHVDVVSLFATAYDSLAPFGYTLWARETDDDGYAGFITLTRDVEPLRELAAVLGIHPRLGSELA
ncbi:DUF6630 family protein [Dyella sp. 20L07]|uniref:DUF6630 family protein n=1 Tax=Dyella sp. 20L07 TaxID=3384240 RepID=UPI003D28F946